MPAVEQLLHIKLHEGPETGCCLENIWSGSGVPGNLTGPMKDRTIDDDQVLMQLKYGLLEYCFRLWVYVAGNDLISYRC